MFSIEHCYNLSSLKKKQHSEFDSTFLEKPSIPPNITMLNLRKNSDIKPFCLLLVMDMFHVHMDVLVCE